MARTRNDHQPVVDRFLVTSARYLGLQNRPPADVVSPAQTTLYLVRTSTVNRALRCAALR